MPKTRKTSQRKARHTRGTSSAPAPVASRRSVLRYLGWGGLGGLALAGGGVWSLSSYRAFADEHDLSRLGQGHPALVQVHDPSCPQCTALQRQTRRALRCLADVEPIYLVANLDTVEGATFAARFNAPRVTLLLFDGQGALSSSLAGVRDRDDLKPLFERHFRAA